MDKSGKIIIGAIGGAVLIGGVIFLPGLLKTGMAAPQLDVIPRAMIHKIDLSGITVRLDVQINNPTTVDFKMKYPYFRLVYDGTTIGSSQSINQDVGMDHLGEAHFSNILFNVPLLSLFSIASSLIKAASNKEEIKMQVEVITHIDPYWKYDDETKKWKRLPNLGTTSMIAVTKTYPVTLLKQNQS